MDDDDDVQDILSAAEGDRDALGRLYDRHAVDLSMRVRRIVLDAKEAEDIVHDVFLEVWTHAGDYAPTRGSVRGWLRVRARSRALDRLRSARRRERRVTQNGTLAEEWVPFEHWIDGHHLDVALSRLPAAQRAVVRLGYFEGLSSPEIAARIGIPVGTVKSRVAGAMAKLRAHFRCISEERS